MHVKLNTISILLIIVSMLVCITTIMLYSALDENLMINRISRGYYGDHAVHFKFASEERGVKETIKLLKNSKYKDVALIYDDHESALRQIYIKGRYVEPPMLSGRFLKESDFFKNQRLAVVGQG